jgi:outer membrane protein assembly factor BamB
MKLKQAKTKKLLVSAIIVIFLILVVLPLIRNAFTPDPSPWQIAEHSPEFSPIATHEIHMHLRRKAGDEEIFMILRDDNLVFYESNSTILYQSHSFNRINLVTSTFQWQHHLRRPVTSITNNEQTFFIAFDLQEVPSYSGKTLVRPGAILVTAYDIDTGNSVWSSVYKGFGWVSHLDANENEIGIDGHNGHGLDRDATKLDARTGEILEGEFAGLNTARRIRCQFGDMPYYRRLKDLPNCHVVIARNNEILVLDLETNSIVWQENSEGTISNLAVSNGIIYFLAQDGILWALDVQTGTTLGHVQFEPVYPRNAEPLEDSFVPDYTVVADGNGVALHFMETQQLFFFHFSRSDE